METTSKPEGNTNIMNYIFERKIPFYYLYDTKGSEIYNEITELSEYYPYKKEEEILKSHVDQILTFKDDLKTEKITLVEFGAGYSLKTEIIIAKLLEKYSSVQLVPMTSLNLHVSTLWKNIVK